jgi:predicted enzyme related to lactoylglutathione lyase
MGQPVIHSEIGCKDIAKTQRFFSELFGWQTETAGPAAMIDTKSDAGIA